MGYRGQHNRDEDEARRYRAAFPLHVRVWHGVVDFALFFGPGIVIIAVIWWLLSLWHIPL